MHKSEQEQLKMGTATTLDEDVYTTVMRDMKQVAEKLKVVLLPLGHNNESSVIEKLREWDLWGPLLVCLLLSSTLGLTAPSEVASAVFAAVFVIVWAGAAAVTINAQLLGGTISFFQSVCILGYCVFPLTLSAIVCTVFSWMFSSILIKLLVVGAGFVWSTRASVVFMQKVIHEERRTLAVFPVFLFYTFIGWMIFVNK
jgi:protein YIPF6